MEQPKELEYVFFRGAVHYPATEDDDYYGYDLRKNELQSAKKAVVSKAVLLNHKIDLGSIGIISRAGVGKAGELLVNGFISNQTPAGTHALKGLMNGTMRHLSLGVLTDDVHPDDINKDDPTGLVEKITPYEVSLVDDPARGDCDVDGFLHSNGNLYYFKKWENLEQFMQNGTTTTTTTQFASTKKDHLLSCREEDELHLSSSRIEFEIPPQLQERLIHRSRKPEETIEKMATPAAPEQPTKTAVESQVEMMAKQMKFASVEAFLGSLQTAALEKEAQDKAEAEEIDREFQQECLQYASKIGMDAEDVKGMDIKAKAMVCAAAGGFKEKEAGRSIKERTLKASVQQVTSELELTRKENVEMKNENAEIKKQMEELKSAVNQMQQQPQMTKQSIQSSTGFKEPEAKTANQPQGPAPGTAFAPMERVAGLRPVPVPPSCFTAGSSVQSANPANAFGSFLKQAKGNDHKWKKARMNDHE